MKRLAARILLVAMVLCAAPVRAQDAANLPAASADEISALELSATRALVSNDYAAALPQLKKLAVLLKDDPARVGPVLEQIRMCETQLGMAQNGGADGPGRFANRVPHPPPNGNEPRDLTIQELGNFDYDADKGGNIPEDVVRLSGSTIRVRGFMIPMDQAEQITQFALVPDLFACCFGQPPEIQHIVIVNTPKGKSVSYYADEIQVEGTLTVQEKREDGFIVGVFEMEASSVRPAPQ